MGARRYGISLRVYCHNFTRGLRPGSWSLKNRLVVHEGKFEAMILSTKPFIGPMKPLKWGDDIIWHVSSSECLGVTIDDKLSWSQH